MHSAVLRAVFSKVDTPAVFMAWFLPAPLVVLEATYGWYWAVDVLQAAGAEVHLAHPLGVKAYSYRQVKNDPLTELPGVTAGHRLDRSFL